MHSAVGKEHQGFRMGWNNLSEQIENLKKKWREINTIKKHLYTWSWEKQFLYYNVRKETFGYKVKFFFTTLNQYLN